MLLLFLIIIQYGNVGSVYIFVRYIWPKPCLLTLTSMKPLLLRRESWPTSKGSDHALEYSVHPLYAFDYCIASLNAVRQSGSFRLKVDSNFEQSNAEKSGRSAGVGKSAVLAGRSSFVFCS